MIKNSQAKVSGTKEQEAIEFLSILLKVFFFFRKKKFKFNSENLNRLQESFQRKRKRNKKDEENQNQTYQIVRWCHLIRFEIRRFLTLSSPEEEIRLC